MIVEFRTQAVEDGWRWQAFRRKTDELLAESLQSFPTEDAVKQWIHDCRDAVNAFAVAASAARLGTLDIRFHYGRVWPKPAANSEEAVGRVATA